MLSFTAEFPVSDDVTPIRFCNAVVNWICGSRYTLFTPALLQQLGKAETWEATVENEVIETFTEITDDSDSVAVVYRKTDSGLIWASTIVYSAQPGSNWVSVRVESSTILPAANVPEAKKPAVIKVLIDKLGGGVDGEFQIAPIPVILTSSEVDVAAKIVKNETDSYLPIVYVSTHFDGRYTLDPSDLAKSLLGMAHVIVEPDRGFSLDLMRATQRRNVYGGNIAIYWPEGGGRRSFFANASSTPADMLQRIVEEVRQSLNNRRPMVRCTVNAVKELKSRRQINLLKDAGSAEVAKYIAAFEGEVQAKSNELYAAEQEILRLKAVVRMYEAQDSSVNGLALNLGELRDYYEGEVFGIVHEAIETGTQRVTEDSRRQHVLQALAEANPINPERARNRERIKNLLRGYKSMDAKTLKELEDIGFSITEAGKHYKLVYQDDDRYTFTLSKSGSDYRGGLNAAGDISRLLF